MLLNGVGPVASARRGPRTSSPGSAWRSAATTGPSGSPAASSSASAIAVALANRPAVLFADEPTGELDSATAHEVFDLLRSVNQELGVTIVVVTHDPLVSEQVSAHDRHPRRPDQQRDPPPARDQRRGRPPRHQRGVRGPRSGRAAAAAARARRGARARAARAPRPGARPHQRLAGPRAPGERRRPARDAP